MSEPGHALLLLNGELPAPGLARAVARRCGLLVCADGGARHARALGLVPDVVVGDMDSLPSPLPRSWNRTTFWCDFDENASDFEKALAFLARVRCRRLYVAGCLGGRLDHALVNMSLARGLGRRRELVLVDRGLAALLGRGRRRLRPGRGRTISLLAAEGGAVVSISGVRYPLRRARLAPGGRGLSNVVRGPVGLTVHAGLVWVMTQPPFVF
ncbi:MAG: thiamine diphosphokinase [Elusimicrobia bacterium]|nr:thiamine diphosphokinase [Elusimicrobiota bacterium]